MNEFTIVTTIGRPVEEVFAVIQDVPRTPVWTPGLTEARQTSEGPLEPGAALIYRGTFLGRNYETPAVCTALTENKQFATKSTAGPFYIEIDTTVEPVAAGTQVTSFYRGESRGFFKLAEALVVRLTRKHFETAADDLRALLEDRVL
jgi:Polyketide cyclase / dehydrase and lipid transport